MRGADNTLDETQVETPILRSDKLNMSRNFVAPFAFVSSHDR